MQIDLISLEAFILSFGVLLLVIWRARPARRAHVAEPLSLDRAGEETAADAARDPAISPLPSR
mgnify:CR=1 FL=1